MSSDRIETVMPNNRNGRIVRVDSAAFQPRLVRHYYQFMQAGSRHMNADPLKSLPDNLVTISLSACFSF